MQSRRKAKLYGPMRIGCPRRTDRENGRAWRFSSGGTVLAFAGEELVADKSPKKQAPVKKLTTKEKKAKKKAKLAAKQSP
jgi:hypothetical protein